MFVLVRQRKSKVSWCSLRVHHVVRLHEVTVDRGVNDKLSQETTEMTTGASLISLQSYQAPCPHNKCHLSPHDWDRKLSSASCQAVININLGFYNPKLYFYWGSMLCFWLRFLFCSPALPSFLLPPTHLHMGTFKNSSLFEGLHTCTSPNSS